MTRQIGGRACALALQRGAGRTNPGGGRLKMASSPPPILAQVTTSVARAACDICLCGRPVHALWQRRPGSPEASVGRGRRVLVGGRAEAPLSPPALETALSGRAYAVPKGEWRCAMEGCARALPPGLALRSAETARVPAASTPSRPGEQQRRCAQTASLPGAGVQAHAPGHGASRSAAVRPLGVQLTPARVETHLSARYAQKKHEEEDELFPLSPSLP